MRLITIQELVLVSGGDSDFGGGGDVDGGTNFDGSSGGIDVDGFGKNRGKEPVKNPGVPQKPDLTPHQNQKWKLNSDFL
jgi:hypothetical protein